MINAGEGGFFCTDDPTLAAKAICYAGCYEKLIEQHVVAPPTEIFDAVKFDTPNYSLRMNDLAAACIRPQIPTLEARIAIYNSRYDAIVARLADCAHLDVPALSPRVRPVCDSLQFNLLNFGEEQVRAALALRPSPPIAPRPPAPADALRTPPSHLLPPRPPRHPVAPAQVDEFLASCKRRGMPVGLFGSKENARNFVNWKYSPNAEPLPRTAALIAAAIDVRLPAEFEEEDFVQMAKVLLAAVEDAIA